MTATIIVFTAIAAQLLWSHSAIPTKEKS